MTTVLVHEWVTGGGLAGSPLPASWAAEGAAMRRAIAADFASLAGVRVLMTLDVRWSDEPGPWSIARVGPGREAEIFRTLAAEADLTALIAPESGGILAERARMIDEVRGRSLGPTAEAIELTADKLALGAHLERLGIATPGGLRVVPGEGLPRDFEYPAVLKPIDGAGSMDTFWVPDVSAVPGEADASTEALLQPFVRGTPMSASFLVERGGETRLLGIGRQRMALEGGRLVYRGGTIPDVRGCGDPALRRAVESVRGLLGFVGVDFIRDEPGGKATVLEINPRPTTSYVALARLLPPGRLARAWIAAVEGACDGDAGELFEIVHSSDRLSFDADGTIRRGEEGQDS